MLFFLVPLASGCRTFKAQQFGDMGLVHSRIRDPDMQSLLGGGSGMFLKSKSRN